MVSPNRPTPLRSSPNTQRASIGLYPLLLLLAAIGLAGAPFVVDARRQWIESRPVPTTAAATTAPLTTTTAAVIQVSEVLSFVPDDLPGQLDVVLVQDETSSFDDDIGNIRSQLVPAVQEASAASEIRFGLAGFQDGALSGGNYQKYVELTEDLSSIQSAVDQLGARNFLNFEAAEPSLSALERALDDFDFAQDAQKVVVLSTDASSKNQSAQRIADIADRYESADVRIVVLQPPTNSINRADLSAYDQLVGGLTATPGNVVVDLQDTSSNLGEALLEGLRSPTFSANPSLAAGCPVDSPPSFSPSEITGQANGQKVTFEITYEASSSHIGKTCSVEVGEGSTVTFEIGE